LNTTRASYTTCTIFARFRANDWRLLRERRASPGPLLAAIFADAIDELQFLMAASGFRLDQRIDGFAFRGGSCIRTIPR
jgi:hypothetical protein